MKIYLVGGAVRDKLLGLEPKDLDYVVVGSSTEEMLSLGFQQVGADFPVFLHPETGNEYALARQERKTKPGYNGFEVTFDSSVTLEDDLIRRDLTINSMAMDEEGNLFDPYGGELDLARKLLRHTSLAFAEDPVRVLRVARFCARYTHFTPTPELRKLMADIVDSGEFDSLTPERVWAEFEKGLLEPEPSKMMCELFLCGAHKKLPEFFGGFDDDIVSIGQYWFMTDASHFISPECKNILPIVFSVFAKGFTTKAAYAKWKIPNECAEVAIHVNAEYENVLNYETLSVLQKVQLFNRVDLRRRPDRFVDVLAGIAGRTINSTKYVECEPPYMLLRDMEKILAIDQAAIAAGFDDKSLIKPAIFEAQIKSLSGE